MSQIVAQIMPILIPKKSHFFLILPLLMYLSFFYAYPMLRMITQSFFDPEFTLKHYLSFFRSPHFTRVLLTTFSISFYATLLCLLLGYPLSYLLTIVSQRTSQILTVLIIIPFWISLLVRTYAWMVLLGKNGILNQILLKLGLTESPLPLMYNRFAVYVGMLNVLLPFMILPLYSVMKGIDKDLVKSAQILGAPPWKSFLRIFLPLSLPGVAAGSLLVFIIALGFFITPALLGGPKDIMISILIETQVEQNLNWGFASAISTILLLVTLVLFLFYNRVLGIEKMTVR